MLSHIPSLATLDANDDELFAAELRFGRFRSQVAVLRRLADEVEQLGPPREFDTSGQELMEEITQLGCRFLQATRPSAWSPRPEDSSVAPASPSMSVR
jgi:hypothetical protein